MRGSHPLEVSKHHAAGVRQQRWGALFSSLRLLALNAIMIAGCGTAAAATGRATAKTARTERLGSLRTGFFGHNHDTSRLCFHRRLRVWRSQRSPAIMDQVLKTMGCDIQCGGIKRVLVVRCRPGALRTQDAVNSIFNLQ